jgi:ADP-ribose pyrophosphatase YjhB (NUDIX family)
MKSIFVIRKFFDLLSFISLGNLPPLVAVGAIIERNGNILLINRSDGLGLCFPGGLIKWQETPKMALLREVAEETGYQICIEELIGVYISRDPRFNCVDLVYSAAIVNGYGRSSDEGKLTWVPKSSLPSKLAFDHELVLVDYLNKTRITV